MLHHLTPAAATGSGLHTVLADESSYWRSVLDLAGSRLDSLSTMQSQLPTTGAEPTTELLTDPAAVAALLTALATEGGAEVSWLRPTSPEPSPLASQLGRHLPELPCGIRIRAVLDGTEEAARTARLLAARPGAQEADLRTSPELAQELLLVDDRIALLPQAGAGLAVLREPTAIRLARLLFQAAWSAALPLPTGEAAQEPGQETAGAPDLDREALTEDPVRLQTLQLLAAGAKDEAIARRTGVSLRTCRRHVAAILLALDANSRFQAGVKAVALGLVDPLDLG
ncbi:hypothetical protein CFP65_7019 [Kitasatospora sp. MMS16-BH015]|uniref:helix-turn-helix domain-containing protein n=1 Tax=Kitasatospora sp. MMS16-BH015 TaxID=2018025 RepID=UPI000CA1191E|nr:helix-turn-helix transcriptional regulator [Kitasatospora sp. MMS16-BH015]AUG81626.1 hypothetical protein CFP65_7019 [Kitasatospora sp. MMS16-BH015]